MSAFYNIGSLVLGFAAWGISLAAIQNPKKLPHFMFSGFTCVCLSLLLQLREIDHRTDIGDYAAIEDTIEAIILAAAVMIGVTVVLNLIALFRRNTEK